MPALQPQVKQFGLQRGRMRAALARRAGIGATDLDALEHLEADGQITQRSQPRCPPPPTASPWPRS